MVKVYVEIIDDVRGFMWRVVAECGVLGRRVERWVGEWQSNWTLPATLSAPTGEGGRVERWVAWSSSWAGMFDSFAPYRIEVSTEEACEVSRREAKPGPFNYSPEYRS